MYTVENEDFILSYPILWRWICIHFVFYAYAIYINYTCNWIYIHIYIPLNVFWFKKDLTVYFLKFCLLIFIKIRVYHWTALPNYMHMYLCAHIHAHTEVLFLFSLYCVPLCGFCVIYSVYWIFRLLPLFCY